MRACSGGAESLRNGTCSLEQPEDTRGRQETWNHRAGDVSFCRSRRGGNRLHRCVADGRARIHLVHHLSDERLQLSPPSMRPSRRRRSAASPRVCASGRAASALSEQRVQFEECLLDRAPHRNVDQSRRLRALRVQFRRERAVRASLVQKAGGRVDHRRCSGRDKHIACGQCFC